MRIGSTGVGSTDVGEALQGSLHAAGSGSLKAGISTAADEASLGTIPIEPSRQGTGSMGVREQAGLQAGRSRSPGVLDGMLDGLPDAFPSPAMQIRSGPSPALHPMLTPAPHHPSPSGFVSVPQPDNFGHLSIRTASDPHSFRPAPPPPTVASLIHTQDPGGFGRSPSLVDLVPYPIAASLQRSSLAMGGGIGAHPPPSSKEDVVGNGGHPAACHSGSLRFDPLASIGGWAAQKVGSRIDTEGMASAVKRSASVGCSRGPGGVGGWTPGTIRPGFDVVPHTSANGCALIPVDTSRDDPPNAMPPSFPLGGGHVGLPLGSSSFPGPMSSSWTPRISPATPSHTTEPAPHWGNNFSREANALAAATNAPVQRFLMNGPRRQLQPSVRRRR